MKLKSEDDLRAWLNLIEKQCRERLNFEVQVAGGGKLNERDFEIFKRRLPRWQSDEEARPYLTILSKTEKLRDALDNGAHGWQIAREAIVLSELKFRLVLIGKWKKEQLEIARSKSKKNEKAAKRRKALMDELKDQGIATLTTRSEQWNSLFEWWRIYFGDLNNKKRRNADRGRFNSDLEKLGVLKKAVS